MFDELNRELRRLNGPRGFSVSIPSDKEGYFDRECPSQECQFAFKVLEEDWKDKVRDDEVFCPFCGHCARSDSWWTQAQLDQAKGAAVAEIENRIGNAMRRDALQWNRRQPRNGLVRVTMKVNSKPFHVPLPLAAEVMQLKVTCPSCECRYAVIGAAFFCPACGHNAAEQMFSQSLSAIVKSLDAIEVMRDNTSDRDTAENMARLLVEMGLQHAVMAFQRFAETLYGRYTKAPRARRNAFQSLHRGGELWFAATGHRFADYMTTQELEEMGRHFQQRHLVAHTQGIVDEEYIERTGDRVYRVGQRVVVNEPSVRRCVALVKKLGGCMATERAGTDQATP